MRFFQKLADIWRHEELRQKLGVTLGLILVYRLGSFIVLPGVNSDVLAEQMSQLGSGGYSPAPARSSVNSRSICTNWISG